MKSPSIRILFATAAVSLSLLAALPAEAQTPPPGFTPAAPPPGATAAPPPGSTPPPGYAPPPAGYAPPPGYAPYPYPYPYPYGAPPPGYDERERERAEREAVKDWEPGEPVPEGYRVAKGMRKGLVVAGAVTAGSLWLINVLVAVSIQRTEGDKFVPLYAPCIGPFIAIGTTNADSAGTAALILDGAVQTAGLAMLIAGVASTQVKLVKDTSVASILPVPYTDGKSAGLGFVGTF